MRRFKVVLFLETDDTSLECEDLEAHMDDLLFDLDDFQVNDKEIQEGWS